MKSMMLFLITCLFSCSTASPEIKTHAGLTVSEIFDNKCPHEFVDDLRIPIDRSNAAIKGNLPGRSFSGSASYMYASDDVVEVFLEHDQVTHMFYIKVTEDSFETIESVVMFDRQGEENFIEAGACSGPDPYNWNFDRVADRAIITKTIGIKELYFQAILFWDRSEFGTAQGKNAYMAEVSFSLPRNK